MTNRPIILHNSLFEASFMASAFPLDLFHIKVTTDQKKAATAAVNNKFVIVLPIRSVMLFANDLNVSIINHKFLRKKKIWRNFRRG